MTSKPSPLVNEPTQPLANGTLPNDTLRPPPVDLFPEETARVREMLQKQFPDALQHPVEAVDSRDRKTPDVWVPRHPDLVRLTGRHPFNCEPPLRYLKQDVTAAELHYVRNHGAVPQLVWESHRIEVCGLLKRAATFTMAQLLVLGPLRTVPVTLVCAGNRRKEMNQVKQTIGFNWGAGGVSTSLWTGVPLANVLRHCGVECGKRARFVSCTGDDNPSGGPYGTSMPLAMAMDPYGDVLLAVAQNGKPLLPDHGFPVRLLVPGWIGGRMVKWLSRIEVTESESTNHYHYFDNRIMPPHVDKDKADAERWWYRPEYLFNELNINSAVIAPDHDEVLPLTGRKQERYTVQGYAYSGGGRQVTRVEITFDGGHTWEMCEVRHPFAPNWAGRCWAWSKFRFEVDVLRLFCATEFAVRAWDCSNNTQPYALIWNVFGMGNNCCFRVKIHPTHDAVHGAFGLRFEHPTVPGSNTGGWMARDGPKMSGGIPPRPHAAAAVEKATVAPAVPDKAVAAPKPPTHADPGKTVHGSNIYQQALRNQVNQAAAMDGPRKIRMEEVEKHRSEDDVWIVVKQRVYDCTHYLNDHPGGVAAIMMNAGADCTEDFEAIHSERAWNLLAGHYIGDLVDGDEPPEPHLDYSNSTAKLLREQLPTDAHVPSQANGGVVGDDDDDDDDDDAPITLDPRKYLSVPLIDKVILSPNSCRFRFGLPSPRHRLGLPVGNHLFVRARIDGAVVMRAYTPTTGDEVRGFFDLVIKVYRANEHPKFPAGGKLSQHLDRLSVGDQVDIKGPLGHFAYVGAGAYVLNGQRGVVRRFGFMCGGTGITPAYQVMQAILRERHQPPVEMWLVYANNGEEDILLREELEAWAEAHENVHVWHTLVSPPNGWKYGVGFIDEGMVREHLPPPGDDVLVGLCGPPIMIEKACVPNLEKAGYRREQYFSF
ncbi:hypothetical protein CDCA_CDCA18G4602 [Cyanidium caldarium]|uniref:Nitrate reductase n=1 Tax=Cyanidium caldarium TaxID=2771 RepID=A0AAV9J1U4_CYACA|nr:hypothetical protein CDCA_CDCA18G4602 [Cyanidium caldarium]